MVDGGEPDRWSAVAEGWGRWWGNLCAPVWPLVLSDSRVAAGARALDVGCGTGDLLVYLDRRGLSVAGLDPAAAMLAHTRSRLPGADLQAGSADRLPWPDAYFDLVTAVNALQFAVDPTAGGAPGDEYRPALGELARVTATGGCVVVANWAHGTTNDLDRVETAVAHAAGRQPLPEGWLRQPGNLEHLLTSCGLARVSARLVAVPWCAADDRELVESVLLGEDPAAVTQATPAVLAAASPYRRPDGSYRLLNHFAYAVGRVPA